MQRSLATQGNFRSTIRFQPERLMEESPSLYHFQSRNTRETDLNEISSPVILYTDFFVDRSLFLSQKSTSCVNDCWFNDVINEAASHPLRESGNNTDSVIQLVKGISSRGTPKSKKMSREVVVTREGTKLMKSIDFPTVLVDIRSRKLHRSTLYYLILELESVEHSGEIACIMLTSPIAKVNSIQTAELLPLKNVTLEPLLLNKHYSCIFQKGCTFKIKALKYGRRIDQTVRKWKNYDMEKRKVQELLRTLIFLDIKAMPPYMVSGLEQLLICGLYQENSTNVLEYLSIDGSAKVSSVSASLSPVSNSAIGEVKPSAMKLSSLRPNLQLRGITAKGGSSFGEWFDVLPPHIQVDEDFTCERSTKLRKDRFLRKEELDKYLSISEVV